MITIHLPHITVQKVTNGYLVQWQRKNSNLKETGRTHVNVEAVCLDDDALLQSIKDATSDIDEIEG